MEKIRYFKLSNKGAFVVRMQILWEGHGTHGVYELSGYHDICAAAERTVDLQGNIPTDSKVTLKAIVVWGRDKTAEETFHFTADAADTANYEISGTTLQNKLKKV